MIRPTIFRKFLLATLLIALVPLLAVSLFLLSGLEDVRDRLAIEIGDASERQASENLQMRARQVADSLSDFLQNREHDLLFLAGFIHNRQILKKFYDSQHGEIWNVVNQSNQSSGSKSWQPLYRSIAVICADGREQIVLKDGTFLPDNALKNVSRPEETEFKHENYFAEIKKLRAGQVYVSHLTGHHVSSADQATGKQYNGVIRFGTPIYAADGHFQGELVISLDHRHLMEFTQHIDPGPGFITAAPTYESGNYAFLFDDEGWIITHPKLWDIRGVDEQGRPVPPYTQQSTTEQVKTGRIPFNLIYAGFIHPNYPKVVEQIFKKQSGSVDVTNVGGARKIMAYAPIFYTSGVYKKHGIFGGVTIGYQVQQFREQAHTSSQLINQQLKAFRKRSNLILVITALLAGLAAWRLARGITKPLHRLSEGARRLASGEPGDRVPVTGSDELADLALAFNTMVAELEQRKTNLISTLEQLQESRQILLDERNFKESILESISSAIITLAPDGTLTSRNRTADNFLGRHWPLETSYVKLFAHWGDLTKRIERALKDETDYGRETLRIEEQERIRHFDVGIFPIGPNAERGLTVTLRDETIREDLRGETVRLERLASLGKLAAGISHEIRNPLTGISLLLDDLHDRASLTENERMMLRKALNEIERIERLTSSLLSFAAPPKAQFSLNRLDDIVHEVAMLIQFTGNQKGITLEVDCDQCTPIQMDADRIRQAVLNLLKNAQEALPTGGNIKITLRQQSDWSFITVSDNGAGINAKDLPLIFEPFFTRKGAGTGLGLSITKRIVEEHGGALTVESSSEMGTCFTIKLPHHDNLH
jgi:signal transduction histidine kinase